MSRWFSESRNQWIHESVINEAKSDESANQWFNEPMSQWIRESMNINKSISERMNGWMDGMEQSGAEWSGVAWSGVEWRGVAWRGVEWSGVEWVNGRVSEWVSYFFVDFFSLRDLAEVPLLSGAAPNVLSLQSGAHFSDLIFQKCSTHLNLFNILTCQLSSR